MTTRLIRIVCVWLSLCLLQASVSRSEGLGVVAVVNDQAITELDVTQRISLLKILGDSAEGGLSRKAALQSLIDDIVKIAEAKRLHFDATEADITQRVGGLAKNMKTTSDGLEARLSKQGIGAAAFRKFISAQIGFNRIISSKYRADIKIDAGDVDAKFADIQQKVNARMSEIKRDPRMKGVTVYTLMEINLPVEDNDAMASQLLQARAVEAAQVARQFKGCKNARAAASGVFNVKIGKPVDADASKLPGPMRAALDKAGQGRVIGPMRGKTGIQLLAFCGSRKITPQIPKFEMPTRQQVENSLINEKYAGFEEAYLKVARKTVYVEYRNASYSQ
jgi:peptidyl-prolyl cis-trans isomerase SurA